MITKNNSEQNAIGCQHEAMLLINKQWASRSVALILIASFFIFVAGYFWGHQKAMQEFDHSIEQQAFADQIHYSLCCIDDELYDTNVAADDQIDDLSENKTSEESTQVPLQELSQERFYAQIAGFASQKRAHICHNQCTKKGVMTKVVKRVSVTTRGNTYEWYQIVTQDYTSKADVLKCIKALSPIVKLDDVRIVSAKEQDGGSHDIITT